MGRNRLGATIVASLSAVVLASSCSASSTPSDDEVLAATPSPSPEGTSHGGWSPQTSDLYGFSLEVPPRWEYNHPAIGDWPQGEYHSGLQPYTDQWSLPPDFAPALDVMTQTLAAGISRAEFLDRLDEQNAKLCEVQWTERIEIAGVMWRLQRQSCPYNAYEAAAFDEDRIYLLYWIGGKKDDVATFKRILSTFRFAD